MSATPNVGGIDYNMMTFVNHFRTHNIVFDAILAIIISSLMPAILLACKQFITDYITKGLKKMYDKYTNVSKKQYYVFTVSMIFGNKGDKDTNGQNPTMRDVNTIIIPLLHKFRTLIINNNYEHVQIYSNKSHAPVIKDRFGYTVVKALDRNIDSHSECIYLPIVNNAYLKYNNDIDVCISHFTTDVISISISIRSCLANASEYITEFIENTILDYNIEQNNKYLKRDLFIYSRKSNDMLGGAHTAAFSAIKVNHKKCISEVHTPDTARILTMLTHFQNKTGIYKNSKTIDKFGLLLHGPPGTGKTSMIKAIAKYLNRSIVNISLTHINSDPELFDIFVKGQFTIDHAASIIPLSNIVYVFEDIDTHCVLNKRKINREMVDRILTDSPYSSLSDRSFTLGGFLNVLDGIVEPNNRVVIMTTNCLDKLDPAIYRPGRVNMCVKLGYIEDPVIFSNICRLHHPADLPGNSESDMAALLASESLQKALFDSAIVNKEYDQHLEESKNRIFTTNDAYINNIIKESIKDVVIDEDDKLSDKSDKANQDKIKQKKDEYFKRLIQLEHSKVVGLTASQLEEMCFESTSIADLHQKYFSDPTH